MSLDPNTAVKVALALWEQRGRIHSPLLDLRRRIKRRQMIIAIFGAGGVGKTTLATFLSDSFDPKAGPASYAESIGVEEFWLRSDRQRKVVVAPGQMRRIQYY